MTTEIDPLATPVSDIDLSYPVLPPSNYLMRIEDAKTESNKAGTGQNLVMQLKTIAPTQDKKGQPVPAGFTITNRSSLTPTEKMPATSIAKNIARIISGAKLPKTTSPRELINNPAMLNGKQLLVKVAIRQETAEYAEANEVKGFVLES